jgi:hypothetical protein
LSGARFAHFLFRARESTQLVGILEREVVHDGHRHFNSARDIVAVTLQPPAGVQQSDGCLIANEWFLTPTRFASHVR